jgi:hypothetical protein
MSRPTKFDDDKFNCPVRTYVKQETYEALLKYCKISDLPSISFAARKILSRFVDETITKTLKEVP